jgi:hypothetical protein
MITISPVEEEVRENAVKPVQEKAGENKRKETYKNKSYHLLT